MKDLVFFILPEIRKNLSDPRLDHTLKTLMDNA